MVIHVREFEDLQETTDTKLRVAVSIAGGSGTGKTYSALLLAQGLAGGGKIAVLDTENKRAMHYKGDFPTMSHFNFGPYNAKGEVVGFPPERWIAALDYLEKEGFKAVVIDSFSHAWEGIGGVLEIQAEELDRLVSEAEAKNRGQYPVNPDKFNQLSWVGIKARYRRLIERIIQSSMDVIVCIRAKPVMQAFDRDSKTRKNSRDTKLRRSDLPWDIASDRDLIFEMTVAMLMVPEAPGQPVLLKCPDHFRNLFAGQERVSPQIGKAMRKWADEGGVDQTTKKLLDAAQIEARKGKAALQAHWNTLDRAQKLIVQTIMDQLIATAKAAEDQVRGDLFAGEEDEPPADDGKPSEEEIAARMAEVERQMQEERARALGQPAPGGIS